MMSYDSHLSVCMYVNVCIYVCIHAHIHLYANMHAYICVIKVCVYCLLGGSSNSAGATRDCAEERVRVFGCRPVVPSMVTG